MAIETGFDAFERRLVAIEDIMKAKKSLDVVDVNLNVVHRYGFKWRLLCLLRPFYFIIRGDAYSHVRLNTIYDSFTDFMLANTNFLTDPNRMTRCQRIQNLIVMKGSKKYPYLESVAISHLGNLTSPVPTTPIKTPIRTHTPSSQQTTSTSIELESVARNLVFDENLVWPADERIVEFFGSNELKKKLNNSLQEFFAFYKQAHAQGQASKIKISHFTEFGEHNKKAPETKRSKNHKISLFCPVKDNPNQHTIKWINQLPFQVFFQRDDEGDFKGIWIKTKKVIGRGGQRKVKIAYNLNTGDCGVIKKSENPFEVKMLEDLKTRCIKTDEHFVEEIYFKVNRENQNSVKKKKINLIERYHKSNFSSLFEHGVLRNKDSYQIVFSIGGLLHALSNIHSLKFDDVRYLGLVNYKYSDKIKIDEFFKNNVNAFHGDIGPQNVFTDTKEDESWKPVVGDFGGSTKFDVGGTLFYRSPELVQLDKECFPYSESVRAHTNETVNKTVAYKMKQGQADDTWAMGLLIAVLLMGETSPYISAPFPNFASFNQRLSSYVDKIKEALTSSKDNQQYADYVDATEEELRSDAIKKLRWLVDEIFIDLTQDELDRDIDLAIEKTKLEYKNSEDLNNLLGVWGIVKGMLKVKSTDRSNSLDCYNSFYSLVNSN